MSKQVTLAEAKQHASRIIQEFDVGESVQFETKKQFIQRLAEIFEPLIGTDSFEVKKPQDFSVWVFDYAHNNSESLKTGKTSLTMRTIQYSLPDHLKRKYSESEKVSLLHQHNFIKLGKMSDGALIRKCECGVYEINGIIQSPVEETEEPDETPQETAKKLIESGEKTEPDSVIRDSNRIVKDFLRRFITFIDEFDEKCKDKKILKDLESEMEWKELARQCIALQSLYDPPLDRAFADPEEGKPSLLNQMSDECNFRAPATILQKAMCKALGNLTTYRQWAHKLSISPRQHQRIRQRLEAWPVKKAERIIANVLGSVACPNCNYNLISHRQISSKPQKVKYGKHWYEVPKKYQDTGLNPAEVAYLVFHNKLVLKK